MKCFVCNTVVDGEDTCPHCGSNIRLYRRILGCSEALYNKGLEQAQVSDLSGAVLSLKESLRYNKYNTKARNLLGLIYFEIGETVLALSEWVLSKNLEPDNPLADRYLDEIQNTPGMLEQLDQTTRKYNQALAYCRQGSRDLAVIQLRKVLGMNPKFVAGHQLLALLYIQDGKYNDARRELNAANKIDVRNTITLRYSREVREKLKEQNNGKKKKKKNDLVAFQDGNDTIVMPDSSFRDMLEGSRAGIGNIFAGLAIGLLICFFLVVPTVRQRAMESAAATLVDTNEELTNTATNAGSLKKQVEKLEEELENYTGKADAVGSYEKLMDAQEHYNAGDLDAAGADIAEVNRDLLSSKGQSVYDVVQFAVNAQVMNASYTAANNAFYSRDYQTARDEYAKVVFLNEDYENGRALFQYAESLWNCWEFEQAGEIYEKIRDKYPNTSWARTAEERLASLGADDTGQDAGNGQDTDDGQNTNRTGGGRTAE